MSSHVGLRFYPVLRFYPTEQELLQFYLLHKITQNPNLYQAGDDIPVKDCDLYSPHEPNLIRDLYGGDQLMAGHALYFFTQLKKASPKGSRFNIKIGFDAWQGEDRAKLVLAVGSEDQILGFKKRFRYESCENLEQNGRWIMHEFTINPALLGDQYSHKARNFVLCRVKKNELENHSEKANLGGKRSSGSKRKLKEVVTSSSHIDHDDECFQSKRLKAHQNSVFIEQSHSPCSSSSLHTVEHQGEIDNILEIVESEVEIDSLPNRLVFNVQEFLSELDQIAEPRDEERGDGAAAGRVSIEGQSST